MPDVPRRSWSPGASATADGVNAASLWLRRQVEPVAGDKTIGLIEDSEVVGVAAR